LTAWLLALASIAHAEISLRPPTDAQRKQNRDRRYHDEVFQRKISELRSASALKIYEEVLSKLRTYYVDPSKADLYSLFIQGREELRLALDADEFVNRHLIAGPVSRDVLEGFKLWMSENPPAPDQIKTVAEVVDEARRLAEEARRQIGIRNSAVILEMAWGACCALDEYTRGLSPRHFAELQNALNGRFASLGVMLAIRDHKVYVSKVYPDSFAYQHLKKDDQLLLIDGSLIEDPTPEDIDARLRGEEGTTVNLQVIGVGDTKPHSLKVKRGFVSMRSVAEPLMYPGDIGYLQIYRFQENTLQEVKSAISYLQSQRMKALILDLRGNPGGYVEVGKQVAELFMPEGVIYRTFDSSGHKAYEANNPNPFTMPLVVLVDSDTASAAEIVAGALKDNNRATLVGQSTFGKGSMQILLPLDRFPERLAGIRVTVTTFSSPNNNSYIGSGVVPNKVVAGEENQLKSALIEAAEIFARKGSLAPMIP